MIGQENDVLDQGPSAIVAEAASNSGAWWSGSIAAFMAATDDAILGQLSHAALARHRVNEMAQQRAWRREIEILRDVVSHLPRVPDWRLLIEFQIPRLGGRIDAVLLCPDGVFILEFKTGAEHFAQSDRQQARDYALDLQDFHAGSRRCPIIPVLVATEVPVPPQTSPFLFDGIAPEVLLADAASLAGLLRALAERLPPARRPVDVGGWEHAAYAAVPNIVEAACLLYSRHSVAEIAAARADAINLTRTARRIASLIDQARAESWRLILFVTGIPGAGKTLCGLNAAFGVEAGAGAFLTGNPSLVHVLREALVRDSVARGEARAPAAHRMKSVIQALPQFRDSLVQGGRPPPERVIVIDEAQRCWNAPQAVAKTRDRPVQLDRSESAHLLDIMARHADFACVICLIGNGQEIHDGEGGLAEWGAALGCRPQWRVAAAPRTLHDPEARNRLPGLHGMIVEPDLHLDVPVRAIRHGAAPAWADAVLRGDADAARGIIAEQGPVPFRLTRSLTSLRKGLRAACRGNDRAGLIASAGARRLRADGLGAELPHMEPDAVARWFLDRYPADVRASDALEVVATQFSVQGLELDHVGLCWDGDLIRVSGRRAWQARKFVATDWQIARRPEKIAYRLNTYRVLLTRARFETIIWVPPGDRFDRTRDPAMLDAVADFLRDCGVRDLAALTPALPEATAQPTLFA